MTMPKWPVALRHEFVESVPEQMDEEVLYVSVLFASVIHLCCCGCGNEVVTPLTPADWEMCFDGDSISLSPSIGNWNFPCQSHYWIRCNWAEWAPSWSREQIADGRATEQRHRDEYFDRTELTPPLDVSVRSSGNRSVRRALRRLFRRG